MPKSVNGDRRFDGINLQALKKLFESDDMAWDATTGGSVQIRIAPSDSLKGDYGKPRRLCRPRNESIGCFVELCQTARRCTTRSQGNGKAPLSLQIHVYTGDLGNNSILRYELVNLDED